MTDDIIQFCFFQAGIKNEKKFSLSHISTVLLSKWLHSKARQKWQQLLEKVMKNTLGLTSQETQPFPEIASTVSVRCQRR